MTITLELTPQEETRLRKIAAQHGANIQDYARRLLGLTTPTPDANATLLLARPLTPEERAALYAELIEGLEYLPAPAPATYDRATAYERD